MYFLIFICTLIDTHIYMQVSLSLGMFGSCSFLSNSVTIGLKLCINGILC